MKIILEVQENKAPFFIELINGLKYIRILKKVENKQKSKAIQDILDAFNEVTLHEEGSIKLKSANQLLDEI